MITHLLRMVEQTVLEEGCIETDTKDHFITFLSRHANKETTGCSDGYCGIKLTFNHFPLYPQMFSVEW